jgi:hypothetical protein
MLSAIVILDPSPHSKDADNAAVIQRTAGNRREFICPPAVLRLPQRLAGLLCSASRRKEFHKESNVVRMSVGNPERDPRIAVCFRF